MSVYWVTGLNGEKDGKHDSSWSVMQGEVLFRLQLEVIKPIVPGKAQWPEIKAASHIATIVGKWRIDRNGGERPRKLKAYSQGLTSASKAAPQGLFPARDKLFKYMSLWGCSTSKL